MNGDITLRIECLMPEKLLNRAMAQGARLSSVRLSRGRFLTVECDAAGARVLLGLCERFSIPARIIRRRGGSAMLRYTRARRTLPAGLLLCAALCCLFLGRVWIIDISFSGNEARLGDRDALSRQLCEAGVRPGMPRGLDASLLAQALQAQAGCYSYVGVHAQGVRLLVEAVPETPAPDIYDAEAARDLVADRDGIVVRAVARAGELCVRPGDAVRQGQALILGREQVSQDETRPIAALGEVIVRAWCEGEASLPLSGAEYRPTGRTAGSVRLTCPWLEWTFEPAEAFESQIEETRRLPIGGLFMPLALVRDTYRETERVETRADLDALKARLARLALADAARRLCEKETRPCEISGSWVSYRTAAGAMRARAVYEIHVDTATARIGLQGG